MFQTQIMIFLLCSGWGGMGMGRFRGGYWIWNHPLKIYTTAADVR